MPVFELEHSQWLALPPQQAFAFFERPENLTLVTPPALDFQLLTPTPLKLREGALIDYTIRRLGLRLRWRTLLSEYRPPELFVDEQLRGPYSLWRHEHSFRAEGAGTRMHDRVWYALPAWLPNTLARLFNRIYVRPQLEHIFNFRAQRFDQMIRPSAMRLKGEQARG